jgi:hypothetical protein
VKGIESLLLQSARLQSAIHWVREELLVYAMLVWLHVLALVRLHILVVHSS